MLAALSFTFDNILVRRGLMEENPGTIWDLRFVVNLSSLAFFLFVALGAALFGHNLLTELQQLSLLQVFLLAFAGAVGPLVGALLYTISIGQIGASHSSALWGGSNPLFAALLAFVLLKEVPDLVGFLAVLVIVGGIVVVGYHGHEGTVMLLKKTRLAGGVLALLSGFCVAFSQVGRGAAIQLGATPGAALLVFHATPFLFITFACLIRSRNLTHIRDISPISLLCYSGAGVGALVASYSILLAFTLIPVWQAVAIRNFQPILVLVFTWLFLKRTDRITPRLAAGSFLVTLGVLILNLY